MADTMQFDLVSPERKLDSRAATAVLIPGAEGDLTAMPGHSPVITTLRPGIVTVESNQGEARYVVTGGFAEVTPDAVSVLAERSLPAGDLTQDAYAAMLADARKAQESATGEAADAAAKLLSDLMGMGQSLGLSSS